MNKLIYVIIISLLLLGCEKPIKEKIVPPLNENIIQGITLQAIKGEKSYNDSLSGLIDYQLPINTKYNNLNIQKIITPALKTYYALMIEYPNPIYNRFAIYDSDLRLLLLDKSLIGKISFKIINVKERQFIEVDESFLSKDILELNRVSLYNIYPNINLAFRDLTKYSAKKNQYYQTITDIEQNSIRTKITSKIKSLIGNKTDTFLFDNTRQRYLSKDNVLSNFVKKEIESYKGKTIRPEIFDTVSALQSAGIGQDTNSIKSVSNLSGKFGYYLSLDEGWREVKDIGLYGFADKLKGDKYYNPKMGSNIFMALISQEDSAELYIRLKLNNIIQGRYRVRFTDKIEQKKYYIQYFEFSCGAKKYLMKFEASKYTYDKYKSIYQDIINSFVMEC
jgi:hypothetical protein